MEITEVRIKLMGNTQDRLKAFCSITVDGCFVVRDLKIIEGTKGPFVAMPSRKLMDRCPRCQTKNHLRAVNCNQCGLKLDEERATRDVGGRAKLYADIAHPINSRCREMIQESVLESFEEELELAQQPGYVCKYDDYGEESFADEYEYDDTEISPPAPQPATAFEGANNKRHRIESAESGPPPPHVEQAERERRDHVRTSAAQPRAQDANDDPFGEGLLDG